MTSSRSLAVIVVLAALFAGPAACAPATPPALNDSQDRAAVEALIAEFLDGVNSGDLDALVAPMAPDAVVLPNGAPVQRGTDAIQAFYQGLVSQNTYRMAFTADSVEFSGDMAWANVLYSGTFLPAEGEEREVATKGLFVFQRESSASVWRITAYMFNTGR